MNTTDSLLYLVYDALRNKKIAKEKYEQCLNERIAAQRKADDAHSILSQAEIELAQAIDAVNGSIDVSPAGGFRRRQ